MRRWLATFLLAFGLSFMTARPAPASSPPVLLFDWGEMNSAAFDLTSFGIQIRLSNQEGLDTLYLDVGTDYGEEALFLSAGMILRPPRPFIIVSPYAGGGLTWHLADLAWRWDAAPYIMFGAEVLCFYWEEEIRLYDMDPGIVTRTGLRIRF